MSGLSRRHFNGRRARRASSLRTARGIALGVLGGFAVGFALWSREQVSHRRDLFSARPLRRLAALGFLAAEPSIETVHLLREYVRWETRGDLRSLANRLLHRVEQDLS